MISYPPTLLLPSPLPYDTYDQIVSFYCDECMIIQDSKEIPPNIKQQLFDYTMEILEFWYTELSSKGINCDNLQR
jgi:hypothetical protein